VLKTHTNVIVIYTRAISNQRYVQQVSSRKKKNIFLQQEKEEKKTYTPPEAPRLRSCTPSSMSIRCFMIERKGKKIWFFVVCCGCSPPHSALSIFGGASAECHLRDAAGTRHCCMARTGKGKDVERLFAGDVTAKGLCLDPVHEDKDTVASCFSILLAGILCGLVSVPSSLRY
jgi:hypothetical protein